MMWRGFEEIIWSDAMSDCWQWDDQQWSHDDVSPWLGVMSIKQRWWQMGAGSGVMMTMSVSWHHVTNVTWHQCRARDMSQASCHRDVNILYSNDLSSPPAPHASLARRERGELNWNNLKWSILHYRIWLTIKTTIQCTRVNKKWAFDTKCIHLSRKKIRE